MVSKLNIYFIHSDKLDYNEELYLPVLRSNMLSKHNLIFPESNINKNKYFKEVMGKSDLFIILLNNPTVTFNVELKEALVSNKPLLALAKVGVPYDEKYKKLLKNIIGYNDKKELVNFIETFVKSYENRINGGVVDTSMVLGVLD